jgi:probable LLM family oxidoreductase
MEIGIFTFVDNTPNPNTGERLHPSERLKNLMEEVELADQVGLEVFGVGEHHREEYVSSAPSVILSAAAMRTKNIRLTSAVTVLSSDDPVRVFQQFATVDLLSQGRAEIMIGRGSFIESYPLFGYDLRDYDQLFSERLDLLLKLRKENPISWQGETRPSIDNLGIFPQPLQSPIPLWIAVGGTPQSAYRAGYLGIPMALAIIGGEPARFKSMADLHRRGVNDAFEEGKSANSDENPAKSASGTENTSSNKAQYPALSINSHGIIADKSQDASDIAFGPYKLIMDKIGRERGWAPMSREQFEASRHLHGANFVGSPQEVIDKILYQYEIFGHQRFMMQMSVGSMPHRDVMRSIELYGTVVAPAVRKATTMPD